MRVNDHDGQESDLKFSVLSESTIKIELKLNKLFKTELNVFQGYTLS